MQELEKILEEMREASVFAKNYDGSVAECVTIGAAERILRKHTKNDGWIPVEDALPEGKALACDKYGEIMIGYICGNANGGYDCEDDGYEMFNVLAWRPLPEPYKPERRVEKMTSEEAIQQLEFDRAMILFDSLTGEEITPEMLKLINKENYLTYVADGIAIEALKELQQYREIGTVEECREAVEKQKPKEPTVLKQQHSDSYNCPKCGRNLILKCGTDWFGGQHYKSCPNCGQAIRWDNNLEGMEDE